MGARWYRGTGSDAPLGGEIGPNRADPVTRPVPSQTSPISPSLAMPKQVHGATIPAMDEARPSPELQSWLDEFEAAARRPLPLRFRYAFIQTYRPVLDDEPFRAFDTMEDYRRWCEENLPDWLGYGRV